MSQHKDGNILFSLMAFGFVAAWGTALACIALLIGGHKALGNPEGSSGRILFWFIMSAIPIGILFQVFGGK